MYLSNYLFVKNAVSHSLHSRKETLSRTAYNKNSEGEERGGITSYKEETEAQD